MCSAEAAREGHHTNCAGRRAQLVWCPSLTASLLLLFPSLCLAAVELNVTVGLGGHAKLGCWTPVRVIVDNPGEATRGELVIPPQDATDEASDYRVPVEAPPSSRRAFMLYARPQTAAGTLRVEFRPARGPRVVKTAPCSWHDPRSRLVLGISRKAGGLGTLGAAPGTTGNQGPSEYSTADRAVAYVTPDRSTGALGLPDRAGGYEGVSAVVLRDISPEDFEDYEREALIAWVESGGLLIIVSGPNVAELRSSFIEKLSPVSLRGQRLVPHLGALAEHYRESLNYGRALVAVAERKRGSEVVVEQDGLPLVTRRPYETGVVYFLAADCAAPPLDSADALLKEMWSDALRSQPPVERLEPLARLKPQDLSPGRGLSPGIVQLPILQWEAFGLLGGYLVAYIAVLVALNLLAKRLDRREWTGYATVGVILAFSLGALFVGSSAKLSACRTYEAGVASLRSGASVAWLEAVSGVRSPAARAYGLSPSAGQQTAEYLLGARRELSWPVEQQSSFLLRAMPVDLWGFGAVRVQGPWRLSGRITARVIDIDATRVAVSVENGTPYDLRWPFVLLPGAPVLMSGLIPAGETRETDPFERSRFQRQATVPGKSRFESLAEHCKAEDSKAAPSPDARMRHRLLRQLGSMEQGSPSTGGWFGLPSYTPPPDPNAIDPFAPGTPIVGAWIPLPDPLVRVTPSQELHVAEVLALVEIPEGSADSATGVRRFTDLPPMLDATARGIRLADEGRLSLEAGTHELRFRVSAAPRPQRLSTLAVTVGSTLPTLQAEAYDCRNHTWRPVGSQQDKDTTTLLQPAADYVRWPWVRVRLTHGRREAVTVYCALSGEFAE